jgi:hypothetical protein
VLQVLAALTDKLDHVSTRLSAVEAKEVPFRPAQTDPVDGGIEAVNASALASSITGERVVPVHLHIESKLKQRILAHEAVEMAALLKKETGPQAKAIRVAYGENGEFLLSEAVTQAAALTILSWVRAWNIFVSIYGAAYPHKLAGLTSHFQLVLQLAEDGGDWCGFDVLTCRMIKGSMLE